MTARATSAAALRALLPTLTTGAITGALTVVSSVSFAALIFTGPLRPFLANGVGLMLICAVLVGAGVAAFSSYPGTVATPQDRIAPILALMAAAIVDAMPDPAEADERYFTVVAAIITAALATGVFLGLMGMLRLGGFIRFIPYPVIGGFLAGTGWLLVLGALRVTLGGNPTPAALLHDAEAVLRWAPGVVLAVVLLSLLRRRRHFLVMPGVLLAAIASFFLALHVAGISLDGAAERGWLLGPFPTAPALTWQVPQAFGGANWAVILDQIPSFATVLLVSAASVLLNSTAIEIASGEDMELNQELRVTGVANLASGLAGGMVGFHSLSLSALALRMGARGRALGFMSALICAAVLAAGLDLLGYLPRAVLGGLLMYLGLSLLTDWVFDGWWRLSRGDYLVVVLILATVGVSGFLPGVAVGLVGAVILFVISYSRVDVVKHELTGADQRSNVDRPQQVEQTLRRLGEHVHLLKLQGYIFFGTANSLLGKVRERISAPRTGPCYVVLDFHLVSGMDSSAELSFHKMTQLAKRNAFELVFAGARDRAKRQLDALDVDRSHLHDFAELDYALEWCEDRLLESTGVFGADLAVHRPLEALGDAAVESGLAAFLEHVAVPAGEAVMRQGEAADALCFIHSGQVSVLLDVAGGESLRLRKMGAGTVTGELGIYLGGTRNASVIADWPTEVYRLSREAITRMEREDPVLAARFHRAMARLISQRLVNTNRTLRAFLD